MTLGCPHGSACGPLYWNIQYNDIFDIVKDIPNVDIDAFADDTIIKIFAKSTKTIEFLANKVLKLIYNWAENNKLIFNIEKTNCVLFTNNQKYYKPDIIFNNKHLEIKNCFKHYHYH